MKPQLKKTALRCAAALVCLSTLGVAQTAAADIKVYGRVTYNMLSDDTSDDIYFGRHEFAETNFGIKGTKDWGGIKLGAHLEVGLNEGVSTLLQNGSNSRNRIQQLTLAGSFGKFSLGTGPSVSWIVSDVDQSGTFLSDPLGMSQRFGATRRGPGGQSQTPFVQAQSIFNERLRYDTPKFLGGATVGVQINEDGGGEIAFKYANKGIRFNAWSVNHGDADVEDPDATDPQQNVDGFRTPGFFGAESGSGVLLGYKHSSGFNITGTSMSADQVAGGERELVAVKVGYTRGKHAFSLSQGNYESTGGADHTRQTFAYNFKPVGGVILWAQATKGDTDGQDSFNAIAIGGMIKL